MKRISNFLKMLSKILSVTKNLKDSLKFPVSCFQQLKTKNLKLETAALLLCIVLLMMVLPAEADTTPPTGTISINSGATYTNSTPVTLTLSCSDASGCSQMQFSNDNSTYSTAETYATSKVWTLSTGDGTKTVYAKFKDTAGNWSGAYSDTIILDTFAPPGSGGRAWRRPLYDIGGTSFYPYASSPNSGALNLQWNKTAVENVLTADINGDGFLEVIASTGSALLVYDKGGNVLWSTPTTAKLSYIGDVDGDGNFEIFTTYKDVSNSLKMDVYSGAGSFIKTITWGTGGYDSGWYVIHNKGDKLVAVNEAGYSLSPRGVSFLSYSSGSLLSFYGQGPCMWVAAVEDINNDGLLEVATSTYTCHNGANANGTSDNNMYGIVTNENGVNVFTKIITDWDPTTSPDGALYWAFADLNNDNVPEMIAFESHDPTYYHGTNHVYLINNSGQKLKEWVGPVDGDFGGFSIADINGDGYKDIVVEASANSGVIYALDKDLNLLAQSPAWAGRILAVNDFDGDGQNEVIVYQASSGRVRVLKGDLSTEVASYNVGSLTLAGRKGYAVLSDIDNDGENELIVAADSGLYVLGPKSSDTTPPTGTITINSGATYTNTTPVTLTLTCTDTGSGCSQMQFSNDGSTYSTAETYATTKSWTLTSGDGTKTVYAKFKDNAGNWSGAVTNKMLVLVRNTSSLDSEETKVANFLTQNGYQYDLADSSTITGGLNVGSYKVIYFRTGSEPTGYNQTNVLNAIKGAVEAGSSLFVEYYGSYLAQYLGWGSITSPVWYPVVYDKLAYVKPIISHEIFNGIPTWDPPSIPDKTEQLLWSLNNPGSYTCKDLSITSEQKIEYWHLHITYGWYGLSTNSSYCQSWGGCTSERSVYSGWISYATHGSGKLIYGMGIGTSNCNSPVTLGQAGTSLMKNLINWSGAYSSAYSDTIVLDTTTPPTTTASPAGGTYSAQSVTLSCDDSGGSGCANIYYTTDGSTPTTSSTVYSSPITISVTTTLKFFAKDNAGNSESVKTETYTIDTTAPIGTITINSGATYTNTTPVTLTLTCTDAGSGCSQMQFSNDNSNYSTAETYATSRPWTLTSGDGIKTVYVKFKDSAGNWSSAYSDTITLTPDTTPPTTTASLSGGTYYGSRSVSFTCSDGIGSSGCANIYYTTDGSTPTTSSAVYSGAINISTNTTLKFFAKDNAGNEESVKTEIYTIDITVPADTWVISTIDEGWEALAGILNSIAIDSNNKVHISYDYMFGFMFSSDLLKYATNASDSWVTSTIDTAAEGTTWNSIAIDSDNKVHISYNSFNNGGLKYATNVSNSWATSTIDGGDYSSIAIDSNNKVHISYNNAGLKYVTNASGNWVTSTIDTAGEGIFYTSIAIDSSNKAHISYITSNGTNYDLKYATNASGSWVTSTIDSSGGVTTSIAIDSNNKVHISYDSTNDFINYDLKYATNASGNWVTSTIDGGVYNSIAIDSNNRVHISYVSTNGETNVLKYVTNASGNWVTSTIDSGDTGSLTSIAIDSNNKVHISYFKYSLMYATNADTTSPTTTASPSGGTYGTSVSVTLSCDDGTGSGCANTYYCLGTGCNPTTTYSGAINIASSTDLMFYSTDNAGNGESVKTETYTIDTTAPTGSITINSGATYTNSTSVTLALSCADSEGSCAEMQFSNDDVTYSPPISNAPTAGWTLTSGDGTKTVYVKFKDTAGNWSGAYSDTIMLDTTISAPSNIEANQNGNKGELVITWTKPADSDFNHIHIYRSTTSGVLGSLIADNQTGIKYIDTGLASQTTYYYTVRAVDNLGNESTNTKQYSGTTLDSQPPAVPTNITASDAGTGGKINLSWTNPADSDFSHVHIYRSTAGGTLGNFVYDNIMGTSKSDTGLTNGLTYYYVIRSVDTSGNESTNTLQVYAAPTAPDTTAPDAVSNVTITDPATGGALNISWTNPADSDFAKVRIYRSTISGQLGSLVYEVTGTSVSDTGLTSGTTYYYTFHTVDALGNESTHTTQYSGMPTDTVAPNPVTEFTVTLLSGGKVQLDWIRSSSEDINYYNIYYDNGTETIDYTTAIATIQHPTVTWTSDALTVGTRYQFAIRAEDTSFNKGTNTNIISVVPVTDPNAGDVSASIKVPQTGKKVCGNMVTVMAELIMGSVADTQKIRLQYKTVASGTWSDIPSTDPAKFPNPDTTSPYFVHWNVTGLADGDYNLRAVATSNALVTDSNPSYITITVDSINCSSEETTNAQGEKTKAEDVSKNASSNPMMAGLITPGVTTVSLPEGALNTDTTINITESDPATKATLVPSGYSNGSSFNEIGFESGQTTLSNNKKATLEIPYKDDNNDGIVDGTSVRIYDLQVCNYSSGSWTCLDSVIDTTNKTVRAKTEKFSLFGLLMPPKPVGAEWNLLSVPLQPSPNTPSAVFGSVTSYPGYILWWDPSTGAYKTVSTINTGKSYWVWGNGKNLGTVSGTETPNANFSISIKKGWNMIGHPFRYKVKVSDLWIYYGGNYYTITDAETNGWAVATVYKYENGAYQFQSAQDGGVLEAWKGYWILSDIDCTLIVPPTPAQ